MILLDTDIVIDIQRKYAPALAWLAAQPGDEDIALPGFVVMELIQGCFNKAQVRKVEDFVRPYPLLWPGEDVCTAALDVYARGRLTHDLGLLDSLIGQLAVSMNLPLHTFNQKHFRRSSHLEDRSALQEIVLHLTLRRR